MNSRMKRAMRWARLAIMTFVILFMAGQPGCAVVLR
jgi:hypothetical protein